MLILILILITSKLILIEFPIYWLTMVTDISSIPISPAVQ